MKTLPTIYKLTEVGNTQQWTMVIDGNGYFSREGIVGGKISENKPTVCEGKNGGKANATTPEEQAAKEAQAKHKKKLEKGYCLTIEEAKKGKSAFYEPMLAHNYKDYQSEIKFPIYSQPKLDGIRCVVTRDGMFSRNGKAIISAPHIFESLRKFFKNNQNAVLDGELYTDKLANDFNKICSLVKRTKPTAEELADSAKMIEYWVYDAPVIGMLNEESNFLERFELVGNLLKGLNYIKIVETKECKTAPRLDALYEEYLKDGYEGQMVRLNQGYENKRSKGLLKRKEFIDEEYEILSVVEGEGNRSGTAGFMEFRSMGGKLFRSNIKGDFKYLSELLKNKKNLIGKQATIKYFNLTPDGIPRFGYVIAVREIDAWHALRSRIDLVK